MTVIEIKPASKQDLQKQLSKFSHHTVRAEIINVLRELRPCSLKEAQDIKILKPSEVEEVLKRFQ